MRTVALALLVLLAGCASVAEAPDASVPSAPTESFGLAPVTGPLVFPAGTREVSLAWLVDELARLTGQEIVYDQQARQALEQAKEWLDLTAPVPADEVYTFVEALLAYRGYALGRLKAGEPTVLGLFVGNTGRGASGASYVAVAEDEVDALRRHPAFLFQYAMHFENIDSRQLQTQLRQLLVDPSGLCNVVPAGERSLILQGYGARLAGLFQLLREVDRHSAARNPPAQTQAEQGAKAR